MQIFETSKNYTACNHPRAGLIVQSARKPGGVRLAPDHPQYGEYVAAFETSIDAAECDALCRALLN